MKITKNQERKVIKNEIQKTLKGGGYGYLIIPRYERKEGKHSKNVSSLFSEVSL